MREFSVPAKVTVADSANLCDAVYTNAAEHPDHAVYAVREGSGWRDVTCRQFADDVTAVAKGLIAGGVEPGDKIALLCKTRYEWTVVDYAIWAAGAVCVPIYETSSAEQISWIISDSGAIAAFVETPEHAETLGTVRPDLPDLVRVWQIDRGDLDELRKAGEDVDDETAEQRRQVAHADDLATLIYTSGTTGRPKGCELTHRNILVDAHNAGAALSSIIGPTSSTLLFLPLAHSFARHIQVATQISRVRVAHAPDTRNLVADLESFRPTFLLAVPRVFEKVYNGAKQKAHDSGKGKIFDQAERTAVAYSQALDTGGPGLALKAKHLLFDKLVYGKLRAVTGGRCTAAISGSAPLGERLSHFFRGIGLTIYEGYGLTETSPAASVNLPTANRIGTVGRPLPGVAIRIDDDGEILVKGELVFQGYWKNKTATDEVFTPDGWLRTGDVGDLDADGYLRITSRKKELIVTAGGKNVAPAVLEDRVRAHPLVSQCIVVGDQQPFIAALITLDEEYLPGWKQRNNKPADATPADLREDPDLLAELQSVIDEANAAVSRAESIRKFRVLADDFTESNGRLTPTMKIKRTAILTDYADEVTELYRTTSSAGTASGA